MAVNPEFRGFCMPIRGVQSSEARQLIKSSAKPVVIKFHSPSCGSCQEAGPKISAASCPYRDDAEFVSVDVDQNPDIAAEFNIKSIPFVAAFKGGELVKKKIGADETESYERFIQQVLRTK